MKITHIFDIAAISVLSSVALAQYEYSLDDGDGSINIGPALNQVSDKIGSAVTYCLNQKSVEFILTQLYAVGVQRSNEVDSEDSNADEASVDGARPFSLGNNGTHDRFGWVHYRFILPQSLQMAV